MCPESIRLLRPDRFGAVARDPKGLVQVQIIEDAKTSYDFSIRLRFVDLQTRNFFTAYPIGLDLYLIRAIGAARNRQPPPEGQCDHLEEVTIND